MVAARSSEVLVPAYETTRRRIAENSGMESRLANEYLFNWDTFNDAASSSEYTVSNGRAINERRIRQDAEGSGRSLI
jgi:hypothetical protein